MSVNETIKGINLNDLDSKFKAAGLASAMAPVTVPDKPNVSVGISETEDVVELGIAIAIAAFENQGLKSWAAVMVALPKAISGIDKVPAELADLDDKEVKQLVDFVSKELPDMTTNYIKVVIEHSIKFVYEGYCIAKAVIDNNKKLAAAKAKAEASKKS